MNCDSCEEPKNSFTAAATGLALIISCGISGSDLRDRQALLHGALDAHQADAEGVLRHFADRAHATVAEVVDVVDAAVAVADVDQHLQHIEDVFAASARHQPDALFTAHATVELHAADGRQVVALRVEEQVVEQVLGRILGRRLAGTHHAVDLDQRLEARLGRIDAQRVGDVRATIEVVRVQRLRLS